MRKEEAVVRVAAEYDGEAGVGAPSGARREHKHIGLVDGARGSFYQCRTARLELLLLLVRRRGRTRSHVAQAFLVEVAGASFGSFVGRVVTWLPSIRYGG